MKHSVLFISLSCLSLFALASWFNAPKPAKIIGLLAIRNEDLLIEQCLKGLAYYTDEIIVLDDASEDNTVALVKNLAHTCNITKIITKETWHRQEGKDRNLLLAAGRERGGTHFIILDADELFTANCRDDAILRDKILSLQPGDSLFMHWIRLWKTIWHFKCNDAELKQFIFCDDGQSQYPDQYLHTKRIPAGLNGTVIDFGNYATHGVLHFQAVNWRNMRIRQAWYQCLERIRQPHISPRKIANSYSRQVDETNLNLARSPAYWFAYDFFDEATYHQPDTWREQYIENWIHTHGYAYFKDLGIWDIDWHFDISGR